jgi:O-antigen/teichoic acid export membrane protein
VLRKLGRDAAVYGGTDLVFKLFQFLLIPLYTRYLSVAQFGIMALLQVGMLLIGGFANLGINFSIQRYYYERPPGRERAALVSTGLFELTVSACLFVGLALLAAYGGRETLQRDYSLSWPLIALALVTVVPDQVSQYTLDTSRWQFAPLRFAFLSMVKNVLGLLIGAWLMIGEHMGLFGLFLGAFIGSSLAVPLGLWLVRRDLGAVVEARLLSQLLRFGVPFMFSALAFWAFSTLDRWLIARLSDTVQVGLYSVAFKFASAISLASVAFQAAWMPAVMRMVEEDPGHRVTIARVISLWVLLLAWMGLTLSLFGDLILRLLTPAPYWNAAPVLSLAAIATVLSGVTQLMVIGLVLAKRTFLIGAGAWLVAAINVGLNFLLIPHFGAVGAAAAALATYAVLIVLYAVAGQRLYPLPYRPGPLAYALFVTVAGIALAFVSFGEPLQPATLALKAGMLLVLIALAIPAGAITIGQLQGLGRSVGALRRSRLR